MDKKKAHTQAGLNEKHSNHSTDNSSANQRNKLLTYLTAYGSITTAQARESLDIYYPPSRIKELRQQGYPIHTLWDNWTSEHGIKHRIGRYVLRGGNHE